MRYQGGCHCGAVRFEVIGPEVLPVWECNCSICKMTGFLHFIVAQQDFKLLTGHDRLAVYQFNSKLAKHTFCTTCGIKSFYTPRSHPDGVSVNARCLSGPMVMEIRPFDGQNWDESAAVLAPVNA